MPLRNLAVEVATTLRVHCGSRLIHLGFSSLLIRFMYTGKKRDVAALWRDFFADTSRWWDHRPEKINSRFPDFKHKGTGESLWLADARNPAWVHAKLAALSPDTLHINVFALTQRLRRYVKAGEYRKTVEVFHQLQRDKTCPDPQTFLPVLNACARLRDLEEGRRVHTQIAEAGCESDVYVANCLLDMYAKCGSIEDAWSVFNNMPEQDVVSWSAMIAGYVKSGKGRKALELFQEMQQAGVDPNAITIVGVLNACASLMAFEEGKRVHEQINQRGLVSDVYVANGLVDMYAKCGSMEDAWSVFSEMGKQDVVSWNAIIGGYVKSGQGLKAMELFRKMQLEGVVPDEVTFVGVLNACASLATLEEGRHVHEQIIQRGCESNVYVATCLVDMYAKCGSIEDAWRVFSRMKVPNLVSWNAMIGGCAKAGQGLKAMDLFRNMKLAGMTPNTVTFVGVLNACANIGALDEGRCVHQQIIQRGCESTVYVANCLVDMYAKCGSIEEAQKVFNTMLVRDVVSWTAMIGGYAMHGDTENAIGLFKRMGKEDFEINSITFTCLLSACSHGGLVKEGLRYFRSMPSCFNILPITEHYVCMVDLLGRAGWLQEAEEVTKRMPVQKYACVWMSLLGACRIHDNIEMAERTAKQCEELGLENSSGHVLLSNMYAAGGNWDRNAAIEEERLEGQL